MNRDLFSNYYLDAHLPRSDTWKLVDTETLQKAYENITDLWERERDLVADRNESQFEEKFIRPMFRELGIPFEVEESVEQGPRRPDYGFFESDEASQNAFIRWRDGDDFYQNAVAIADTERWDRKLDTRGERQRDFENPSYQIHVYLQETPTTWAVLTNGRYWRLYYGPTSHRLDSYYGIDLPAVLETGDREAFKYFYLFFRHEAFLPDASGDCFLDDVYSQSNIFVQELGADLQDNIYEAIRTLAEGFLTYPDNDLAPDDLERIHDSSLIYLYRLIFVLYAESDGRDLLNTDNDIYRTSYSLNTIKQEVAEELDSAQPCYQSWQDALWDRIDELFQLIDQGSASHGIPKDDFHVPAYNGGLFRTNPDEEDSREAQFLATHTVGDAYLARVIDLLTRSRTGSEEKIFVDYSSLDVRHLGSIYEGLLEYKLNVADEPLTLDDGEYVAADEGDEIVVEPEAVYLTTDSGERKTTGSYYTPEYVVEYIVENTLEPLVTEICEDLVGFDADDEGGFAEKFARRIFELKVLDPAMGSGHFLTNVVDYLAREIIDAQGRQAAQQGIETVNREHDINWARRQVAQCCIYGVDLNPLAVELAKMSLWLRTLAAEQPLAFLDHHLKTGNSLVGSDIEEIDALKSENQEDRPESGSSSSQYINTRQGTIEQLMRIYQDIIATENQEIVDKEIEAKYDEFERNKLRQRLEGLANVHTAEQFGLDILPSGVYEQMAVALEDEQEWRSIENSQWYQDAQSWADDDGYFHWKIEYPEVFYGVQDDSVEDPGFDAVIGNPPYVDSERMVERMPDFRKYLSNRYRTTTGNWDLYIPFVELSLELISEDGVASMIVPNKWLSIGYGESLRDLVEKRLVSFTDFSTANIFDEAGIFPVVYLVEGRNVDQEVWIESFDTEYTRTFEQSVERKLVEEFPDFGALLSREIPLVRKILRDSTDLVEHVSAEEPFTVSEAYELEEHVHEVDESESVFKFVTTGGIDRYELLWGVEPTRYLGESYNRPGVSKSQFDVEFERRYKQTNQPKILLSGIRNFEGHFDPDGEYLAAKSTIIVEDTKKNLELPSILGILNSKLMWFYIKNVYAPLAMDEGINFTAPLIRELPLPEKNLNKSDLDIDIQNLDRKRSNIWEAKEDLQTTISALVNQIQSVKIERQQHNLNVLDYIGDNFSDRTLGEMAAVQPAPGVSDTILSKTSSSKNNLRIGGAEIQRHDQKTTIRLTARYKPEEQDEYTTDQWGYTETESIPAVELIECDEKKHKLVREFVPLAVEKADGFAGFRETATKTNRLTDRLEALKLPNLDRIENHFNRYLDEAENVEEIDTEIDGINSLLDEIVYQMYDLSEEEIKRIEESLHE
jgi:type II restriction/modification system DNA methylase subunit YeeA